MEAGDTVEPICGQCRTIGRYCDRSARPLRILQQGSIETDRNSDLSTPMHPREAMENPQVALMFHHYIAKLASWYDLSDSVRAFETVVPLIALDEPVIFNAVIALSAIHLYRTTGNKATREVAKAYHSHCIQQLINLAEDHPLLITGVAPAAVCLLRSYEILDDDVGLSRHLQGACAMLSQFDYCTIQNDDSLPSQSFWNFLREEITFCLYNRCKLKLSHLPTGPLRLRYDQSYLNSMSLILGRIINLAFDSRPVTEADWLRLYHELSIWHHELPPHFQPFSKEIEGPNPKALPRRWFLQDCHASIHQYYLIASTILIIKAPGTQLINAASLTVNSSSIDNNSHLREELLQWCAQEICGIAFTACSPPVLVNAFGPIAFCAVYICSKACQDEIQRNLETCRKTIGWPVDKLVSQLKNAWDQNMGETHVV